MIQERERKLLYVDDTEEQRYAMRRILEGAGFKVIEAASGTEAFRQLAAHGNLFACILDVRLPDMSGYDVCRRIKANPATRTLPVLQISASFADPVLRASGLSGGADAYVAQPVHPNELLALVNSLIRAHDFERILRFQAEVGASLSASLDHRQTVRTIETVFAPYLCDRCTVHLRPQSFGQPLGRSSGSHRIADVTEIPAAPSLPSLDKIEDISETVLVDAGTLIVPLHVGRRHLGALHFTVDGVDRFYNAASIPIAEDIANRAALALQNAMLYTAQQNAQTALVQSEKLAAAGRLSAAIAHEINNPLEALTNLMFLIETSEDTPPGVRAYATEGLSELSRLTHIARQSLGFYRELTGPTQFDLNESIDDTISIYLKRFTAKHIEIERNFGSGVLLTAVKGEIRQVISNLLVNAYDAAPETGILRVTTLNLPTGEVRFQVQNTGTGIPAEVLPHIFEPFFSTKDGTGTGLGLWVSESIIRKHKGTIVAINPRSGDPNPFTTFEVTLPRETNPTE